MIQIPSVYAGFSSTNGFRPIEIAIECQESIDTKIIALYGVDEKLKVMRVYAQSEQIDTLMTGLTCEPTKFPEETTTENRCIGDQGSFYSLTSRDHFILMYSQNTYEGEVKTWLRLDNNLCKLVVYDPTFVESK